eukprot:CAMPEP_0181316758 /NCGR_PEP_ID=MMETSP1101-20121128/16068_1 /TAXON_ID=46948 /ORGANISM="Rhodomonas abbreviata, Strain Caron Lab Isolate" /LENGTH=860 /DNA_ID=CAMNT_0023424031 /DNA_START=128 /DNA_END=2710 /DNA_ORIENTATION=-
MIDGVGGLEDGFCQGVNAEMSCCEKGSGLILPIVPYEYTWSRGFRAFIYLVGLLWCFLGVSVLSDVFMAGIEAITNSTCIKKVPRKDKDGQPMKNDQGEIIYDEEEQNVWNPAVANLTLMALGSSTPEILLSIIEICGAEFFSGELGPGTVVGSASFNLYVITGLCMVALPPGETRRIEGFTVHVITGIHSLLAYVWIAVVVIINTPDVIDFWEALVTFLAMPWLVAWVYSADSNWFRSPQVHPEISEEEAGAAVGRAGTNGEVTNGDAAGGGGVNNLASIKQNRDTPDIERPPSTGIGRTASAGSDKHNYMHYRRAAAQFTSGGVKQGRRASLSQSDREETTTKENKEHTQFAQALTESFLITTHSVYHWEAAAYAFAETNGEARLTVVRSGKTSEPGAVSYYTADGTAKQGQAYLSKAGEVAFEANETSKSVFVPLIHDYQFNPDLDFFVTLEPISPGEGTVDPRSCKTKVTVLDTDKAGTFAFSRANDQSFLSSDSYAFLLIERRQFLDKLCYSRVKTRDQSGVQMVHYHPVESMILQWKPYEFSKQIKVRLCAFEEPFNENPDDKSVRFLVDVVQVEENGEVIEGQDEHTADVKVVYNPNAGGGDMQEDIPTWGEQFRQAINVNAGGDLSEASVADCVMHWISIGWKILAAVVPPPNIWGGWACFIVALGLIGLVTAIIGDLASVFGCLVGLRDTVTAFTVVALGTSLPDTFASVLAIRADDTADNAIGNVTGSNSVNVFLGLGFPWLLAAVYWWAKGPSAKWVAKYSTWRFYDKYKDTGAFVVEGKSLGFNTMIFSILTTFAFIALYIRRRATGAEIGGSHINNRLSSCLFVSLWIIYVLTSAVQVYHPQYFIDL